MCMYVCIPVYVCMNTPRQDKKKKKHIQTQLVLMK
jgi:hypothetical protein